MSRYPHTKLFINHANTVVISGPHLHVLDTITGSVLHSTTTFPDAEKDALLKAGPVRCAAVNSSGNLMACAGDDKQLKVWDIGQLKLLSSRELPKKPTSIHFTKDDNILVSDKFGDVFKYSLQPSDDLALPQQPKRDALTSHENPSGGQLILGHASLLTAALLTREEQFIVTADRDEHIRISWYPEGYTIESYCLGHEKFVSAIHVPPFSPELLISGGGDPMLKFWDWMTGTLKRDVEVFTVVQPFIKAKVPKRRKKGDGNDGGADTSEKSKGKRGRRKTKGKEKQLPVEEDDTESHRPMESTVEMTSSTATAEPSETVFVVHKINSFESNGQCYVVFSAVGATAIFIYVDTENDMEPNIRHFDFGSPVIDFTLTKDGSIWVLLDVNFVGESDASNEDPITTPNIIRVIQWSSTQFIERSSSNSPLLGTLNSACICAATPEELKVLDLYSDLHSLPKNTDEEADAGREGSEMQVDIPEASSTSGDPSETVNKKILGRLKHKRALERLQQEPEEGQHQVAVPESKRVKADDIDAPVN
ncbi:WD40-repeat-containing domain protein [Hygrophoropsis aurantiaca]|uniref:WD40-repeat-containing domain protein n=1 Tax=Hygrophoropsis aurantiaca TaxID=72124 RepID=A0ACB8AI89_9AGAM|nr:WD40-repeat-containing domain protein [Hygrophoropsis aurantiaca]